MLLKSLDTNFIYIYILSQVSHVDAFLIQTAPLRANLRKSYTQTALQRANIRKSSETTFGLPTTPSQLQLH